MKQSNTNDIEKLKRSEYVKSYQNLGQDKYIMSIAEEGIEDYFDQLDEYQVNSSSNFSSPLIA